MEGLKVRMLLQFSLISINEMLVQYHRYQQAKGKAVRTSIQTSSHPASYVPNLIL